MTSGGSGERLGTGQLALAPLIGRGDWKSKKKKTVERVLTAGGWGRCCELLGLGK